MSYDSYPPNGVDRADGSVSDSTGAPIGTPNVPGAVAYRTASGIPFIFEELSDSPEIERGEQCTIQHRFKADRNTALALIEGMGRGRFLTDSHGNITRVVNSRMNWAKGDTPIITITAESISFDTPPDEFNLQVIELNPAIEKHPRYAFLTIAIRNLVNQAVVATQTQTQTQAENYIKRVIANLPPNSFPFGTNQNVSDAAVELLTKRRIGEDTFYLPGFRCVWAQYFWKPRFLNPGGYIGDPIIEGLPWYFWSVDWTPDGQDIFSLMALANPQFYSLPPNAPAFQRNGISWLRQCDTVEYGRTWFKVTYSWHGAPYAHWDSDLYSQDKSPYPPPPALPLSA